MSEEKVHVKKIRTPSPDELANATALIPGKPKEKKEVKEIQEVKTKIVEVAEENVEPAGLKPNESIFSPVTEIHELVCKGTYPKLPDDTIQIRRMTTVEETIFFDALKNIAENDDEELIFNQALNKVIENCIRTDIYSGELNILEKAGIFIHILALSYGKKQTLDFQCASCNTNYTIDVDLLKDLIFNPIPKKYKYPFELELTSFTFPATIKYRYPNISEESEFLADIDSKKIISQLIVEVKGTKPDGEEIVPEDYLDLVKALNSADNKKIKDSFKEFGTFGFSMALVSTLCNNQECELKDEPQVLNFPLSQFLINALQ